MKNTENKPVSKSPEQLKNVRIAGVFFILLGISFAALFKFNIVASIFGLFFVIIGITGVFWPKAVKTVIKIIANAIPISF